MLVGQMQNHEAWSRDGEDMPPHEGMEPPACGRVRDALALLVWQRCPRLLKRTADAVLSGGIDEQTDGHPHPQGQDALGFFARERRGQNRRGLEDAQAAFGLSLPCVAGQHLRRWHGICAIKSNRTLGDKQLSQWPHARRHQRYQRVPRSAADQRLRTYLVRTQRGKLTKLSFEVCVLISQRHHREKHPKYFLCTDLALSAQQILPMYQKRWPIEVDNFYGKQHLGLADFRVQTYEATAKWFAVVFVALAFLQWRLNHAPAGTRWRSLADVVRQHRYEHTRTLLETACQEAARLADDVPVVQRFLSQPA